MRSAVILIENDQVALIERVRDGRTYYLFPGGTVEKGETIEAAAIREAYEELGVHVELQMLAALVRFDNDNQYYYHAKINAGQFGAGTGEEFGSAPCSVRGSYRPIWLPRPELPQYDIRPSALAQAVSGGLVTLLHTPIYIDEV